MLINDVISFEQRDAGIYVGIALLLKRPFL